MATDVLADEAALRRGRRERALAQMESHGIDVLLLGREANARYVAGAPRLWTAGTRPFGPSCVVVRATGAIHLVSTWDEGIPEDIPHENLFGITWNPGNLLAWLQGIEGAAEARRVGTDSLTPRFARLLPKVFPGAELVDAEPVLQAARRIKLPEEIDAIRVSVSVAEQALAAAVAELRPDVSERHLAAAFMGEMANQGVTTPATQRVARITSGADEHRRDGAYVVGPSDVVTFDAGVVAGGYVGEVARTWPAGRAACDGPTRELYQRAEALWGRLLEACQVDAPTSDLLAAYWDSGQEPPSFPIAHGLGLGFDVPVVTGHLPNTAAKERFEPGMVLAITAYVANGRQRSVQRKDVVLIGGDGPEVLTSSPDWHG